MKWNFPQKYVVGLTGSMASGKSTVLACFAKQGAAVISADEVVRKLYASPAVCRQLTRLFGTAKPEEIALQVFRSPAKKKQLEQLLYPSVLAQLTRWLKTAPKGICVVEVPLLFEAGWHTFTDLNVLVVAPQKTLSARLAARGLTRAQYRERVRTQWTDKQKRTLADVTIYNQGTKTDLAHQVARLYKALHTIYSFQ